MNVCQFTCLARIIFYLEIIKHSIIKVIKSDWFWRKLDMKTKLKNNKSNSLKIYQKTKIWVYQLIFSLLVFYCLDFVPQFEVQILLGLNIYIYRYYYHWQLAVLLQKYLMKFSLIFKKHSFNKSIFSVYFIL
jgi:hypothetical protein